MALTQRQLDFIHDKLVIACQRGYMRGQYKATGSKYAPLVDTEKLATQIAKRIGVRKSSKKDGQDG